MFSPSRQEKDPSPVFAQRTTRVELSYQAACQHTTHATLYYQTDCVTVIQTERAEAADSTHDAARGARARAKRACA